MSAAERPDTIDLDTAVSALDPVIALLALVQITGDRTLLHRYGHALDGTQNRTREAFVAIDGEVPRAEADAAIAQALRAQLLDAIRSGRSPVLPRLDPPLFREMARLALGLQLPELSMEPAFQLAGFTTDTRVRVPRRVPPAEFRVLVVGAGMMGINAAIKLKQAGFPYRVIECLHDVGGTWQENTYPGAAVDTPSRIYSYSFEPNAAWTRYFPNGPEFLEYLNGVVDKYGVREDIDFGTRVNGARWDEARRVWTVSAERDGEQLRYEGNVLVMATGPNNGPKFPDAANREAFEGVVVHSAAWDASLDLRGKRVVLVGAACSGVQVASAIADTVGELSIVMRQPEYMIPNPQATQCVDPLERWAMENIPFVAQWKRLQALSSALQDMHGMIMKDPEHHARTGGFAPLNDGIRAMCLDYIRTQFPDDPAMVELLTPDYPVFAKRPILDCSFYETLKKPNVRLVKGALAGYEKDAVVLEDGTRLPCEVVVLATGYQMHWGTQFDIAGRDGRTLRETFTPAPFSYEGMLVPGFPNFMLAGGPHSHLVANHAVVSEQQVHYLVELLQWMVDDGLAAVEVSDAATRAFLDDVEREMARTAWANPGSAHGYYRHPSGKVVLAIPRHNSRIWHALRQPRTEDFEITRGEGADAPAACEAPELSI